MTDETITIAGQVVSMRSWSVGSQLATTFQNRPDLTHEDKPLTLKHQMAIAYNAGFRAGKEESFGNIDLRGVISSLDNVVDQLRTLQRGRT